MTAKRSTEALAAAILAGEKVQTSVDELLALMKYAGRMDNSVLCRKVAMKLHLRNALPEGDEIFLDRATRIAHYGEA